MIDHLIAACGYHQLYIHHTLIFYIFLLLQVNQGTVIAVGPGRRTNTGDLIPVAVKEGDKVLLPEYGGTPVKLETSAEKE